MQSGVSESWSRYYALLGALSWALILGLWAGLPGFALVSWSAVAVFVSAALLVLVLAHYLSERNGGTSADAFEALVE